MILLGIGIALLAIILLFALYVLFLTLTEYKPSPVEKAEMGEKKETAVYSGEPFRIVTFNTGYAGLGKDADFVLDGGKGSGIPKKETMEKNMAGIADILQKTKGDVYMIQEIDKKSSRTSKVNQLEAYNEILPMYDRYYAPNYVCKFVPFPLQKPIASIHSGIATYSKFTVESAERIALPIPFSWPVRTANLKRCVLKTVLPIENSDKKLVIFNFHLEAYDSGEGKAAQTEMLYRMMQEEYQKGNYVIAGGDFNQTFPDVTVDSRDSSAWIPGKLDRFPESWEGWRYVYDDSIPTCRSLYKPYDENDKTAPHFVIDGFIVSPGIEVTDVKTLDEHFVYSDHNPVILDVKIQNP